MREARRSHIEPRVYPWVSMLGPRFRGNDVRQPKKGTF